MKKISLTSLLHLSLLLALGLNVKAAAEEISLKVKLGGGAKFVVPIEQRQVALDFLDEVLNHKMKISSESLDTLKNPFYPERKEVTEAPVQPVVQVNREPVEVEIPVVDEMQVLKEATNLLKSRVRGVLAVGGNTFLTTADGTLIGKGTEIPLTFQDQPFVVSVVTVSERSFTLQLGDVRRRANILEASNATR